MHSSPRQTWIDQPSLQEAAELLRTIAHPIRLRLIQMILRRAYTVGELAEACGVASPIVSGHLRLMQQHGLLAGIRDGRQIHYRVVEPSLSCLLESIANQSRKPVSFGCGCCHREEHSDTS